MKGRFLYFLVVLQVVNMVAIAKRPFLPKDSISHQAKEEALQSSQLHTKEPKKALLMGNEGIMQEAYEKGNSKIGSSPPSCEKKCYGCVPCEAIQVPDTNIRHNSNFGIQYANYEPETWKCKCGPSFYSP